VLWNIFHLSYSSKAVELRYYKRDEIYFTTLLDYQILLKSPPLKTHIKFIKLYKTLTQCKRGCMLVETVLQPFQSRENPKSCRTLQPYNSPGEWAREQSKPSTDSASLVVKIEKKRFSLSVGGFLEVTSQKRHVLEILAGPGPQPIDPLVWLKVLLKTRSKSASIEPWIDFLAYLQPKL